MKLGFFGFGNLARALDGGIVKSGKVAPSNIWVCDMSEAAQSVARDRGHNLADNAAELFANCDLVAMTIKPKIFRAIGEELGAIDTKGKLIFSPMAAVRIEELKRVFSCPVMRIMPTIAATDCRDIVGYTTDGSGDFTPVIELLNALGSIMELDEDSLDRLTVAASCGLGFAAHIMETYRVKCTELGFSDEEAAKITSTMFSYASEFGTKEGGFAGLESRVATRGGVTEAGNLAMNDKLYEAISSAFSAACDIMGMTEKK